MRTTIDIPDPLFRRIKANAALRGETLRAFLLRALQSELENESKAPRKRVRLPLVHSREASYKLSPGRLADALEEEDRERVAGY